MFGLADQLSRAHSNFLWFSPHYLPVSSCWHIIRDGAGAGQAGCRHAAAYLDIKLSTVGDKIACQPMPGETKIQINSIFPALARLARYQGWVFSSIGSISLLQKQHNWALIEIILDLVIAIATNILLDNYLRSSVSSNHSSSLAQYFDVIGWSSLQSQPAKLPG